MVLSVLIIVKIEGLNTSTNGPASPVAAYWCSVQLQMSQQLTERMINDFKDGLAWNEQNNDSGNVAGFFTNLQWWFVCLLVSTRTSRQERTAVWPACPVTPSARSSLPAWVTDLCVCSTGGWVQMNGKTHTHSPSIFHATSDHISFLSRRTLKLIIITQFLLPSHHYSNTFKNTHNCFCEH